MVIKGFLEVEKEGNTNYYTAAVPQKKGLQREIDRFLEEVVGPEPENLELLERAVEKALRRKRWDSWVPVTAPPPSARRAPE